MFLESDKVRKIMAVSVVNNGGRKENSMAEKKKENRRLGIALAAIGIVFVLTRLFLLTSVPRGLHVDEAGMAYDAFCLANYGTDRYMTWHPVYLTNYGSGQSALYAYLASIFIRVIGFRPAAFRLPAVCLGAVTVIFGYLIGRETMKKRSAVILAGLITLCPYYIMSSRWGLDCNLLLGFFTMSLYWLILAVKRQKTGWFALAGASFGVTLYTYAVSYVLLPLFLLFSFFYLLWNRKIKVKHGAAFVVPLAVLALPLLLFIAVNMGYLEPIFTPLFTIHRLEYYRGGEFSLANIPANRGLLKMLLTTDLVQYNGFPQFGTLYYISVPFLLMGIVLSLVRMVKSVINRSYDAQTFVAIMFWIIMAVDLVMMLPNINKSNAVYFPFIYFVALAFDFLMEKLPFQRWVTVGIVAAYGVCFLCFGNYYYFHYPEEIYPQQYFNDSLIQMLDRIEEEYPGGMERNIYVDVSDDNVSQPYIYTLIRKPLSPEEWNAQRGEHNSYGHYRFFIPEETDESGIYIMYSNQEAMERLSRAGFIYEEYNGLWRIYRKEGQDS